MTAANSTKKLSWAQLAARIQAMPPGPERDLAIKYALDIYGEAPQTKRFAPYRFEPHKYIDKFLHWTPWRGQGTDTPGQAEILDAYQLALRQQFEKRDFEAGVLPRADLKYWQPGQIIRNYIRMEAGHNTGKTKIAEGMVCHFFDSFAPATVMLYAPTWDALKDNLWQELKGDREGKNLPGRVLQTIEIYLAPKHFIKGRAVSNSKGIGTEKVQGIHTAFQMFVIDEAEGVDSFVFDAIDSMTSGGISIVLMMANPKTRTSKFHRIKGASNVMSFRMSCINHPNVVAGREIVPNAVQREYVRSMVEKHCEVVHEHDIDKGTFELDFAVNTQSRTYEPGTIFQPDHEFMWRVLGKAPADLTDMTVIPSGRFEAALKREDVEFEQADEERATFGIDVARGGVDYGTMYVRWKNMVWRGKQFYHQDSKEYFHPVLSMAQTLAKKGVKKLHIRIDAGGGGGLIDTCKHSLELRELFEELVINEVHFGGNPKNTKVYDDLVTEMYFEAKETLLGLYISKPPEPLESDLTLREWEPVNRSGKELKKLQAKKVFKKVIKRSPDDGDGFVLCVAPDHCFKKIVTAPPVGVKKESLWTVD